MVSGSLFAGHLFYPVMLLKIGTTFAYPEKKHLKMKPLLVFSALFSFSVMVLAYANEQPFVEDYNQEDAEPFKPFNKNAFKVGESLTYRLHYGFVDAGRAVLEVKDEDKKFINRSSYHVVGLGSSIGAFDWFFKVRDRYESYIDRDALVPYLFIRNVDEGGYKIKQTYVYNHHKKEVITEGKKYKVPHGVQDMISAFYYARNLDFSDAKEGQIYSIPSFVDEEIWNLKIKFVGRENLKTDLGTFRCLKFRPIIQKGRVFKKEEDLNVWISDDGNHIPVRAQAEILVGSIKMDLLEYKGLANPVGLVRR